MMYQYSHACPMTVRIIETELVLVLVLLSTYLKRYGYICVTSEIVMRKAPNQVVRQHGSIFPQLILIMTSHDVMDL